MCVQCDNIDFEFSAIESVEVEGRNYSVITHDVKDTLPMILSGITFGDNYAATVIIDTGDLVIDTADAYYDALMDNKIDPRVSNSMTLPYSGQADLDKVETGHKAMLMALQNGILPTWQPIEDQRQVMMFKVTEVSE